MTVHESSLSAIVHAILAAELGKEEKAVELVCAHRPFGFGQLQQRYR